MITDPAREIALRDDRIAQLEREVERLGNIAGEQADWIAAGQRLRKILRGQIVQLGHEPRV